MKYYSLNNPNEFVSFKEALTKGLAPDKGLYFPESIPVLGQGFIDILPYLSNTEIAYEVLKHFVGEEIPERDFKKIVEEAFDFELPTVALDSKTAVLELFHGPSMAFKDVGARFMAGCLSYFEKESFDGEDLHILVATSGDTGGAVAAGFYGKPGVKVHVLYPKGKVSEFQEHQLTSLGDNIYSYAVNGDFDKCQHIVKQAFIDPNINLSLSSANSINIGRWLSQMIYYFIAYKDLNNPKDLAISVPSGNFGNICAGLVAREMGLPIKQFIAATNANDTVVRFMETKLYAPNPTVATISNAMDVSNPSNFVRIQELLGGSLANFEAHSYSDAQAIEAISELYQDYNYVSEPHGAIAYLGLQKYLKQDPEARGLFLATAHPVKFMEVLPDHIQEKAAVGVAMPESQWPRPQHREIVDYASFVNSLESYVVS